MESIESKYSLDMILTSRSFSSPANEPAPYFDGGANTSPDLCFFGFDFEAYIG